MKELSLHILDIVQNSVTAGATLIEVCVDESTRNDTMTIDIKDNGCGISKEKLTDITNPFKTSRQTRKVGLGLSLFQSAALACDGSFAIDSLVGKGTEVKAVFKRSHIDRAPLGNMPDTVITLLMSIGDADLLYKQFFNERVFSLDTREIKEILESKDLMKDPDVIHWVHDYVKDGLKEMMEEEDEEIT